MSQELVNVIQAITSLLSIIIATLAVIVAVRADTRAAKRFESETILQEKIAKANLRPILTTLTSKFEDNKGVLLKNAGIGTAVITEIVFTKGDKTSKSLVDFFKLPLNVSWDYFWTFGSWNYYLEAGKSYDLIRLTAGNLGPLNQGFSLRDIAEVMSAFQEQMSGITIKISYEDVLGNKQPDYVRTLE